MALQSLRRMQIVPRILNERCSIVFTVKGDMQRTLDPVSPRTLSKTSARRAKTNRLAM